jgi:hypothetical protein
MVVHAEDRKFHPEPISRRGETIAWGSALLIDGVWMLLVLAGQPVTLWIPILALPLTLIAVVMSLGNWIERRTTIEINQKGIYFSNGFRRVRLQWEEIMDVRVLPGKWGNKVQVFGKNSYFGFHTLGEVMVDGRELGRTGFSDGDLILQEIVDKSNLIAVQDVDDGSREEGYYYIRK